MGFLEALGKMQKIRDYIASAIVIVASVTGSMSLMLNNILDEQQVRAQQTSNLIAYTLTITTSEQLRKDPAHVNVADLRMSLEICGSSDFRQFYYPFLAAYERNNFDNACQQSKRELINRNS